MIIYIFALNCLLGNGLGMKTLKTDIKMEGDSSDLISLVAVIIYPGERLWAYGWLSETLGLHVCVCVCVCV